MKNVTKERDAYTGFPILLLLLLMILKLSLPSDSIGADRSAGTDYSADTGRTADSDSTAVLTITEVLADADDDKKPDRMGQKVTISGRATVATSVMAGKSFKIYVQDQTAGLMVFADSIAAPVSRGDSLIVSGKVDLFSGTPEILVDHYKIIDSEPRVPVAIPLEQAFVSPSRFPGMLVGGEARVTRTDFDTNATMLQLSSGSGAGEPLYVFVSRANTRYGEFNFGSLSVGDRLHIEGILDRHYSEYSDAMVYEVLPRTPEDMKYRSVPQQYRNIALWVGGAFFLLVAGWVVALKRQVRSRTRELTQAVEEKELLMQEMHHRVKNNLSVISSILELQKYEPVESVDALIEDTQSRVRSITQIHEKLYQNDTLSDIDMKEYVNDFVDSLIHTFNSSQKNIRLIKELQAFRLGIIMAVPIGLIINELFSNAFKHGFADTDEGIIKISLKKQGRNAIITVANDGNPLPENYVLENNGSLGGTLIKSLTEQLKGTVEISTGTWTTFRITVPIAE